MGSDSFQNLPRWKNFEILVRDYQFVLYNRPGFEITETWNAAVTILSAPLLEISSTTIREQIKAGKSIRYLVPDEAREEIVRHGYYKS